MFGKVWIPAALTAVTLVSFAQAQTTPGTTTTPGTQPGVLAPSPTVVPGPAVVDPRFVDPRIGFFDPRLQFNGGSLGFTPGVTTGNVFIPANGDGFFFYNPWGYSGPMVDARGAWMPNGFGVATGARVPIAGLNSPPLQPGARITRIVDGGSGSGYDYESLARADALSGTTRPAPLGGIVQSGYAPSRIVYRGETAYVRTAETVVSVSAIDPQQVRLAGRMEDVMQDRPLTEGTVVGMQDGGVLVRFAQDGAIRVERFARGQVFFFHRGGLLATASTDPEGLQPGDEVLIPLPTVRVLDRETVAGARQETMRVRVRRVSPARRPAK